MGHLSHSWFFLCPQLPQTSNTQSKKNSPLQFVAIVQQPSFSKATANRAGGRRKSGKLSLHHLIKEAGGQSPRAYQGTSPQCQLRLASVSSRPDMGSSMMGLRAMMSMCPEPLSLSPGITFPMLDAHAQRSSSFPNRLTNGEHKGGRARARKLGGLPKPGKSPRRFIGVLALDGVLGCAFAP